MISARGAMPTSVMLEEVALGRARASRGDSKVLAHQLKAAWAAMSKVLRGQLLLGHSVCISPKTCSLYITHALAMHDGRTKYLVRVPNVAFHPQFATTYSLDSGVPREPNVLHAKRLPLDLIAAEAKLPADIVSDALREAWLFIGESVFQGRLMMLEFDGVGTVLLKRDRMTAHFADSFLDELYHIDTRKWPQAAKDAGERVRPRPLRDPRESRSVATPRPASARPRSASTGRPRTGQSDRPVFVANAPRGRLFEEIADEGPRAVRMQEARLAALRPGSRQRKPCERRPLIARGPIHQDPKAQPVGGMDVQALLGAEQEEESIYSVLTPHRHRDVATPAKDHHLAAEVVDASPESVFDAHGHEVSDVAYDEGIPVPEPRSADQSGFVQDPVHVPVFTEDGDEVEPPVTAATQRPPSSRPRSAALNIFDSGNGVETPREHRGRKRVEAPGSTSVGVADLMWYREPSPRTVRSARA